MTRTKLALVAATFGLASAATVQLATVTTPPQVNPLAGVTVLHGGSPPTFGSVSLTADVTGNLPPAVTCPGGWNNYWNFWRGDNNCRGIVHNEFFGRTITSVPSATAVNYFPISGAQNPTATETTAQQLTGHGGIYSNLSCQMTGSPGASKSLAITLRATGTDTALTCTMTGSNTTCVDNTNSYTDPGGAVVDFSTTPTGTPATGGIKCSVAKVSTN